MMAVEEVVEVDDEKDELHRLDRVRILVKTPWQPLIQHKVSAWINGVEYTVHIAEETCYNLDRCKYLGRSFIGSSEEISSDDNESEIGTQMAIEGIMLEQTRWQRRTFLRALTVTSRVNETRRSDRLKVKIATKNHRLITRSH